MFTWDSWKKGFDIWEEQTAQLIETMMRSPAVLGPAGTLMGQAMKMKTEHDKRLATAWGNVGLPTRRDQERTLYALNQLQSSVLDLQEQLAEARAEIAALKAAPVAAPAVAEVPRASKAKTAPTGQA